MDDDLAKPVRPDELRSTLARHLGGNGAGVDDPHAVRAVRAGQTAADDAPIVDIGRLRDLGVVGEEDRPELAELVDVFGVETPELIARLGEGIDAGSVEQVRAAAHDLKGSAAAIGADRIAALAEEVDRIAKVGTLDGVEDLLARIDGAFGTTIGELRALARRPTGPAGTPEPDPKVVA